MMHRLQCSEVWGGINDEDVDAYCAGIHASLYCQSCDEGGKGGDLYYFSVCNSGALTRIAIADVIGHGQATAQVSQWLFEAMKARMNDPDSNRVLEQLNAVACQRGLTAMTTAAVAAFCRGNSRLYFAYAGHHPVLVWRRGRDGWQEAEVSDAPGGATNLPLGVISSTAYAQASLPLSRGDRLALYTDGVLDATDSNGEPFGLERLRAALNRGAGEPLAPIKHHVLGALRDHTAGAAHRDDDRTLLIVEVH
jgi:phosphoserine phosphatase RsbU/P